MKQEDWQMGTDSTVKISDRIILHQQWLKELKEHFKEKKEVKEEEHIPGGFDD